MQYNIKHNVIVFVWSMLIAWLNITWCYTTYPCSIARASRPESVIPPVGYNNFDCSASDDSAYFNQLQQSITNLFKATSYCKYIPIFTSTTITIPGAYCLNNAIQGPIVIASSDVLLDLNSYNISSSTQGVTINPNLRNITLMNGSIVNTSQEAVYVFQGCSLIQLKDIQCYNCAQNAQYALNFNASNSNFINTCIIDNVSIFKAPSGIYCNNVNNLLITNVSVENILNSVSFQNTTGITLKADSSANNAIISNCSINNVDSSTSSVFGIQANNISNLILKDCIVSRLYGINVAGYGLHNAPQSSVYNCSVYKVNDLTALNTQTTELLQSTGARGFSVYNCVDLLIKQAQITDIASRYYSAYAIFGTFCSNLIIKDAVCNDIVSASAHMLSSLNQPPNSYGIHVDTCSHNFLDNCYCNNIISYGLGAYGFHILNSAYSVIHKGHVSTLIAPQASLAYRIFNNSSNILLQDCTSINMSITAAPYVLNQPDGAIGFDIQTVNDVYFKNCVSTTNNAPVANARAVGFNDATSDYTQNITFDSCYTTSCISATANLGNGMVLGSLATDCTVKNCVAKDHTGSGLIINAPKSVIFNSQFLHSATGITNNASMSVIYDTTMMNCTTGLANNATAYTVYCCSATGNTSNYSGNTTNLHIVSPGSMPVVGNNISG